MIQVVALFILCGKLFNKEIHQLLYGEMAKKQQVGKMSGNLFSLILGAVVLTLAYWVILKYFMVAGGMMIIVAVILGIVGTMLFIRGLAGLLSAAAASVKRNTTHGLYIFTLRQFTRKYSPQVYFNRRCVYFDYAYYHAHCRRINPHYVVWEPNDAGIFCLRFYRHGQ